MPLQTARRITGVTRTGRIVTVGLGVAAAAMVSEARQPSQSADLAAVNARPRAAETRAASTTASASNAVAQEPVAVTITGCLEDDNGTFVLKQTSGAEAPKSRSWKSGFLKKSSASIEVIDAANRLRLPTYVGQRVSLTGMLANREMRVRLLQPVAGESCD